ncbi:hypothetical protein CDAR_71461 [Caerostris darwini]|uniref:Uncharacterized protein n=1 Tax=Caerostris darwini TaxID=1538125 RepID=A0AAV4RKH5_9ARAC|nr:hypothetical protein CDAR_71461 [Caerostris darwini]
MMIDLDNALIRSEWIARHGRMDAPSHTAIAVRGTSSELGWELLRPPVLTRPFRPDTIPLHSARIAKQPPLLQRNSFVSSALPPILFITNKECRPKQQIPCSIIPDSPNPFPFSKESRKVFTPLCRTASPWQRPRSSPYRSKSVRALYARPNIDSFYSINVSWRSYPLTWLRAHSLSLGEDRSAGGRGARPVDI